MARRSQADQPLARQGSLSFWIRSGLREKARQGHLVGTLPWGYVRDPQSKFLSLIFENVWLEQDRVVAVQPKPSFLPYFERKEPG